MTIGEKIKSFRTLQEMTQKTLGEITGIGEATIRKYELGIRNPKPAQLKKIAQALGVGENVLLGIPLNTLTIETIGDAMSLFFLLESRLGISFVDGQNEDGTFNAEKLKFRFDNATFNKYLTKWLTEKHRQDKFLKNINSSSEAYDESIRLQQFSCEIQKAILMKNQNPL